MKFSFLKYSDMAFSIAGSIIAPPLVGLVLGQLADNAMGTKPIFAVTLLFLGIIAGLTSLWRIVDDRNRPS